MPKPSKRETLEKVLQAPDMNNLESDPRMQKLDAETADWNRRASAVARLLKAEA